MKHLNTRERKGAVKVEANELNKWYACRSLMPSLERRMQARSARFFGFYDG